MLSCHVPIVIGIRLRGQAANDPRFITMIYEVRTILMDQYNEARKGMQTAQDLVNTNNESQRLLYGEGKEVDDCLQGISGYIDANGASGLLEDLAIEKKQPRPPAT